MPLDTQCGICTEDDIPNLALKIRSCGHIFHEKCVTPWFYASATNHDKCPYCRTQLFRPDIVNPLDDARLLRDIAWLERNADDLHVLRRTVRVLDGQPDCPDALLELASDTSATASRIDAPVQEVSRPTAQPGRIASPSPATESTPRQTNDTAHSLPQDILDYRERINIIERRFQVVERRVRDLVSQTDTANPQSHRVTLS